MFCRNTLYIFSDLSKVFRAISLLYGIFSICQSLFIEFFQQNEKFVMSMFERIELLRKERGISQGKLEKELRFSNGSISKWKQSTPNPERLKRLAEYFGVSFDYLITGEEKEFEVYLAENAILLAKVTKNKDATQNATQNKKSLQDFSCRLSFNKMGCY